MFSNEKRSDKGHFIEDTENIPIPIADSTVFRHTHNTSNIAFIRVFQVVYRDVGPLRMAHPIYKEDYRSTTLSITANLSLKIKILQLELS